MNIGYIYDMQIFPPKGGNHVHATELINGFLRRGHDVSVVNDPSFPGVKNYDLSNLRDFKKNIDILYVRIDARFVREWDEISECMDVAGELPVVWEINAPSNESLAYSWLSGRDIGCPDGIVRTGRRFIHAARKYPGIWKEERQRKLLAQKVDAAICVSSALGEYASQDLGIKNVQVLPNGGPLLSLDEIEERRARSRHGEFCVLYSGSAMYPWQGLDYLTQVISLARHEAPEITFVLAVNQVKQGLPDSDNVVLLQGLGREEILDTICGADACVSVHPEYPWAKYGFHNSPMKLFEYMACARPSVVSNHGQMREVITDRQDGLLCENHPRDILSKLLFLQNSPDLARQIGFKAWERIQNNLSWDGNVVENTLELFQELLGKSSAVNNNA